MVTELGMGEYRLVVRRKRSGRWVMVGQRIGGNKSVVRRRHCGAGVMPERGRVESGAWDRTCLSADLVMVGQRMGVVKMEFGSERIVCFRQTDRLYGGNRAGYGRK